MNSKISTPLRAALEEYRKADWSRLHMPGHKGAALEPFGNLMEYDVTEVEGTDSLFEDDGPLKELEEIFTKLYGTRSTVISAGGSTLCIQAMLRMVARPNGKIVAGRNIHAAAVNAMALLGLEPEWVYPTRTEEERLIGRLDPQQAEKQLDALLQKGEEVCAVYVTSPDYFGVMSDIRALAEVAHSRGVPLLVDNAHGAHLRFLQEEALHPSQLGADLCCDSLHKTMPSLTGAALLHCMNERYVSQLKGAMAMFGSTSPNYLIMLSIDAAAGFLLDNGAEQINKTAERCARLRQLAQQQGFMMPEHCEPMRLTLPLAGTGYTAESFRPLLRAHQIMEEYLSDSGCVLLFSPFSRPCDYERVEQLLRSLSPKKTAVTPFPLVKAQRVMGLRDAMLSPRCSMDVEQAEGRISAQVRITCPPGIPLVMPGERLHKDSIKILKKSGIFVVDVVE